MISRRLFSQVILSVPFFNFNTKEEYNLQKLLNKHCLDMSSFKRIINTLPTKKEVFDNIYTIPVNFTDKLCYEDMDKILFRLRHGPPLQDLTYIEHKDDCNK